MRCWSGVEEAASAFWVTSRAMSNHAVQGGPGDAPPLPGLVREAAPQPETVIRFRQPLGLWGFLAASCSVFVTAMSPVLYLFTIIGLGLALVIAFVSLGFAVAALARKESWSWLVLLAAIAAVGAPFALAALIWSGWIVVFP